MDNNMIVVTSNLGMKSIVNECCFICSSLLCMAYCSDKKENDKQ